MKTVRWLLCIIAFFVVILGCGEDPKELVTSASVDGDLLLGNGDWWRIVYINGKTRRGKERLTLNPIGLFRYDYAGENYEEYAGDPEAGVRTRFLYTIRGHYTTQGNILTLTKASTKWNVEVSLEPEAAWQEQIEGITLEDYKLNLAAELKKGLQLNIVPLIKDDTEYTWEIENGTLTLSNPQQTIVLSRDSTLTELLLD